MSALAISFKDIQAAYQRVKSIAHRTPVKTSQIANELVGAQLFFKCENEQRVGAFKFRGALNAISQFTPEQLEGGVIAYSSGNHAQAIALAAKMLKTTALIVMPSNAPEIKLEATRGYGAEVFLYDRAIEDRELIGQKLKTERGMTLIPPYDHAHVIAGQGTVAFELCAEAAKLDMLIVPVGGGGLISGCAVAAKRFNPECVVIGVEPEAGNDAQQSFRSGNIVHIDVPNTIADGAQTQHLGQLTFPIIQKYVDDIVTVSDAELVNTMSFLFSRMKMVVEPTGCLAAAAVLEKKIDVTGKRVGIIVSGGNVDPRKFAALIQAAPT